MRDALTKYWRALSDKRMELLRKVKNDADYTGECLFCEMVWVDGYHHTNDCELAEAIDVS